VDKRALFCSVCGAVQGPNDTDHFTRLGLPMEYHIHPEHLDRQYLGFQRRMHPDRFATKTPKEKALSQAQATALNDAYETLTDPVKRAVYLLGHVGHAIDLHGAHTISDPVLLMEQLEMREALEDAETLEQAKSFLIKAEKDVHHCQHDMAEAFQHGDHAKAAKLVLRLKYLSKLVEDAKSRKSRLAKAT
jgi:molecular chaperone HscB